MLLRPEIECEINCLISHSIFNFLIPLALTGGGSWEIGPTYLPPGTYLPEPPGGLKRSYVKCIRNSAILWISHHSLEYSAKLEFREILIKIGAKIDEKR